MISVSGPTRELALWKKSRLSQRGTLANGFKLANSPSLYSETVVCLMKATSPASSTKHLKRQKMLVDAPYFCMFV